MVRLRATVVDNLRTVFSGVGVRVGFTPFIQTSQPPVMPPKMSRGSIEPRVDPLASYVSSKVMQHCVCVNIEFINVQPSLLKLDKTALDNSDVCGRASTTRNEMLLSGAGAKILN